MKRSYNSTGRQKILHSMVAFDLERDQNGVPVSFNADLTGLKELTLPLGANVVVEPFYKHSAMRFDYGTVGLMLTPENRSLNEIDTGGEIMFRVKVVDNSQGKLGRLIASGDRFSVSPPSTPTEDRMPILPVRPSSIGEKIWDVSTADGPSPYLLVNIRIPGIKELIAGNAILRGAILVEAFRKILTYMFNPDGSEAEWFDKWKTFLAMRLGVEFPEELDSQDDSDAILDFIDNAVSAFADNCQFATAAMPLEEMTEVPND